MDFQHSQPQSVYRIKNYRSSWMASAIYLFIALLAAPRAFSQPGFWNIAGPLIWLVLALQTWWQSQRYRLVMSPAGISVAMGRRAATPWSNVERLQVIAVGRTLRLGEAACLVLRDPAQATLMPVTRGVPDELKGRVMLLNPGRWERVADLEQELYGYLRANSADQNQLSVPYTFAAISQRQERLGLWAAAALILITGVAVYIFLF
jgi:hypothetical protein